MESYPSETVTGLPPLKTWVEQKNLRLLKAMIPCFHFDHSGSHHAFDRRADYPAKTTLLARSTRQNSGFFVDRTEIETADKRKYPGYPAPGDQVTAAPLTRRPDEGGNLDPGEKLYRMMRLPGPSHGSTGLSDIKKKNLICGDMIYDEKIDSDII